MAMTQPFRDALREKIEQRLNFYEDLRIAPFYRDRRSATSRALVPDTVATLNPEEDITLPKPAAKTAKSVASALSSFPASVGTQPYPEPRGNAASQLAQRPAIEKSIFPKPVKTSNFFELLERVENDTLLKIREDIGDCTRCRLHEKRNHIVFADGNPKADLVFVGEGPGADEDATGIPFVGRAGKLLTQMIEAMGLQRKDVYICNVVKCRPPENRQPEPDEVTTCSPYLVRQLEVVNPKVIVCLGATAAKTLLETDMGISKFRGQWLDFRGKKLLATYHPAYLLRNPAAKSEVWKDLQKVMAELGLEVKKSKSA
jgi:uracil-DNA glycosylase family 4